LGKLPIFLINANKNEVTSKPEALGIRFILIYFLIACINDFITICLEYFSIALSKDFLIASIFI